MNAAYEAGERLTPERVGRYSVAHPRSGTAFLLYVVVLSNFVCGLLGRPSLPLRIATRLAFVPVIASVAYEAIRFSARRQTNPVVRLLLVPGLALQALTTHEPDDSQVQVAIAAARSCAWLAVVLAVAAAFTPGTVATVAGQSPEADLPPAFTAAWNARDVEGALAFFAGDAQVRQRNTRVVQYGVNVDVGDVYGAGLSYEGAPPRIEASEVLWATGEAEIRRWLTALLPGAEPVETTNHRVAGSVVTWEYRVPLAPHVQRAVPGMPPASGSAEALVVDGRIARLVLTSAPGVAARREQALAHALDRAYGYTREGPLGDRGAVGPPHTQARRWPAPGAGLLAAVVCLVGTACWAALPRGDRATG